MLTADFLLSVSFYIKSAHNLFALFNCVLGVVFVRDLNIFVSHKLRDHFYVDTIRNKVAGKGTAKRMGTSLVAVKYSDSCTVFFQYFLHTLRRHTFTKTAEKQGIFIFGIFIFNTLLHIGE